MDIQGYHVTSEASGTPHTVDRDGTLLHDGFTTIVTNKDGVIRGPFLTIKQAIDAAKAWKIEERLSAETAARMKLIQVEQAAPTITEVPLPETNPPMMSTASAETEVTDGKPNDDHPPHDDEAK